MSRTALVVVDMLNSYAHSSADRLVASVEESLPAMTELLERARSQDVPVI